MIPDARALDPHARYLGAQRARTARTIRDWPVLSCWNDLPCRYHRSRPTPVLTGPASMAANPADTACDKCGAWGAHLCMLCKQCGVILRGYQRTGAAWLYLAGNGLLADVVGLGKAQPLDAKVLTPSGWRLMGDLQPGDALVDPDGSASEVAAVFPRGVMDVYRVTFSDGTWAESTLDHLWQVRSQTGEHRRYLTRLGREPRDRSPWKVVTLGEIMQRRGKYAVPLLREAPDLEEQPLPVDPYLLGLLLGDGALSKNCPEFGSADAELLEAAERLRPEGWGWKLAMTRTGCDWFRLAGSQPVLRDLGLFGLRSWEKHVPGIYMCASAKTRLAVLQGLMDTDGYCSKEGLSEFSSASVRLAADVADLARSLGLKVSALRLKRTSFTYQGSRREGRPAWRVTISARDGVELFRLTRKIVQAPRQRVSGDLANAGKRVGWDRQQRVKWIREISYSRTVPVQCIKVTAPSQLYVTDNWTVTHNTAQVAAVLALCKETGELGVHNRAVIICKSSAVGQWGEELVRMIPSLRVITAPGSMTAARRRAAYCTSWEVVVLSDRTLAPARGSKQRRGGDIEYLQHFTIGAVVYDDIDPMRTRSTRSATAVRRLTEMATVTRVIGVHGTPVQKKLTELYNFLEPVGGRNVLGTESQFRWRYIQSGSVTYWARDQFGRVVERKREQDLGVQNEAELQRLIAPLVLRRRPQDVDDISLPEIVYNPVWLDMSPRQAARYAELRAGVLRKIRESGEAITHPQALAFFTHGQQICSGLATLDAGRDDSAKLDWVMDHVTGDFEDDKAVVFVYYKPNVQALSARLEAAGVGHVLMWGNEADSAERGRRLRRFREDRSCRVLVGTTTIEQSLNLQVARHLVAADTIPNPARMTQLVGRVRRAGSPFLSVFFHQLLLLGTHEEAILAKLHLEQQTADTVWGERGELFQDASALEILQMIADGRAA